MSLPRKDAKPVPRVLIACASSGRRCLSCIRTSSTSGYSARGWAAGVVGTGFVLSSKQSSQVSSSGQSAAAGRLASTQRPIEYPGRVHPDFCAGDTIQAVNPRRSAAYVTVGASRVCWWEVRRCLERHA
ncbi:hypothetical protein EXIGLDRAFT_67237 [Exidia glandulosa HHB12029]|uniref:Uncharacterized protein n=1 Tax=Exidia glandulosa HHB12029 TaxID=1314781 RepID=A0A165I3A9_EXIGL|nr:hypothetical protein EXIGLDRAFT_67237 [Exidia glandulosa HHB12029]